MERISNISHILDGLIVDCRDHQKHTREMRKDINYFAYCKEHQTIKLSLPRQSGHTTAALELLQKWGQSILIVPHQEFKNRINVNIDMKKRIFIKTQFNDKYSVTGLCFNMIIVDMAFAFSSNDIERIYENSSTNNLRKETRFVYVFLQ